MCLSLVTKNQTALISFCDLEMKTGLVRRTTRPYSQEKVSVWKKPLLCFFLTRRQFMIYSSLAINSSREGVEGFPCCRIVFTTFRNGGVDAMASSSCGAVAEPPPADLPHGDLGEEPPIAFPEDTGGALSHVQSLGGDGLVDLTIEEPDESISSILRFVDHLTACAMVPHPSTTKSGETREAVFKHGTVDRPRLPCEKGILKVAFGDGCLSPLPSLPSVTMEHDVRQSTPHSWKHWSAQLPSSPLASQ